MLEMKPKSYLLDAADLDERYAGSCIFGVIQTPDVVGDTQLFILGDVFLRHFYSVYDYENAQVRLAVNSHSVGKVDIYSHDQIVQVLIYMGIFILILIASVIGVCCITSQMRRNMEIRV